MMKWLIALALAVASSDCLAQTQQSSGGFFDEIPLGTEQETTTTSFTNITPSTTANTKGSYTQLIASTTNPTNIVCLNLRANPAQINSKNWLVDIATGAAASEVVIIPNLDVGVYGQYGVINLQSCVPLRIPAGTRISARSQSNGSGGTVEAAQVKLQLFPGGFGSQGIDAIGAVTASSFGTTISCGNGSKSAYTQLTASTSKAYKGFFLAVDSQGTQTAAFGPIYVDIATGGSGSEANIFTNYQFDYSNGNLYGNTLSPYYTIVIPTSSRVSFRCQSAGGSAVSIGVVVYGIY